MKGRRRKMTNLDYDFIEKEEKLKKYVGKKTIRVYVFVSKQIRENHLVSEFKEIIEREFFTYLKEKRKEDVKVIVYDNCYVVIGDIESYQLRIVGRRICSHLRAGRLCRSYEGTNQLFHCTMKIDSADM